MKKNIYFLLSILLIISLIISILVAAFFYDKNNLEEANNNTSNDPDQNIGVNIRTEPPSLHPGNANDVISNLVIHQMYEGLTRFNSWGKFENGIATVIKISDDQKTYTFILKDANWSNGEKVTAKDFEFAWKWILDPSNNSENSPDLFYIKGGKEYHEGKISKKKVGVKALDDKTLEVKLEKPTPNFLEVVSGNSYFPVNSKVAQKNPNWANDAGADYITNGPFKLTEWSHGNKIILEKNNEYWDSGWMKLNKITMYMINDPEKELGMYKKGEIDWAGSPIGELQTNTYENNNWMQKRNLKNVALINGNIKFKMAYLE